MLEMISKGFKNARLRIKRQILELTEDNIKAAVKDVRISLLEADVENFCGPYLHQYRQNPLHWRSGQSDHHRQVRRNAVIKPAITSSAFVTKASSTSWDLLTPP